MEDKFNKSVLEIALKSVKEHKLILDTDSKVELKELIDKGISLMKSSEMRDENKQELVENNVVKLVEGIAGISENQSSPVSKKSLVQQTKEKVSPLWPFC